jgi:hypothetical protein
LQNRPVDRNQGRYEESCICLWSFINISKKLKKVNQSIYLVVFIKEMIPYYLERMKKSGENVMVNTSLERFKMII